MDTFWHEEFEGQLRKPCLKKGVTLVWQCTNHHDFREYILPYTILNNPDISVKYLHFGSETFSEQAPCIQMIPLNASDSFETFTFEVYGIISLAEPGTLFLFDFLSALQEAWVSDMMIANFFSIICPLISASDSIGIFPLLRKHHSYRAVQRILMSSGRLIDFQVRGQYLRMEEYIPSKEAPQSHFLVFYHHDRLSHAFTPLPSAPADFAQPIPDEKSRDIWERYFDAFQLLLDAEILSETEHYKACQRLLTKEAQMKELIVKHFSAKDYIYIRNRMIGTGRIGGKACGFLLGRNLISTYDQDASSFLVPQDSFFIGADVFYSYLVENDCWSLRLRLRSEQESFREMDIYRKKLLEGSFSHEIQEQFSRMLKHYGNSPLIIRSSSFLEDSFGNAFSGKYESVFFANQGDPLHRLSGFEQAVRKVYASTLSRQALAYRRKRGLLGQDEQMALLVQKVSGQCRGQHYMPLAAGVGFSYNPYRWMEQIDPKAGMLRLVAGLGTRAVSRTPGDYPRLIGLDRPHAQLYPSVRERHKHSQRHMDVLDLKSGQPDTIACELCFPLLSSREQRLLFSHDTEAEAGLRERGDLRSVFFTDCQGLVDREDFLQHMCRILSLLETGYGCPVDIEFALCLLETNQIGIDLLQCRPLKHFESHTITIQEPPAEQILFDISQASMRTSKVESIDTIIMVDPQKYYETPYAEKAGIALAIGELNRLLGKKRVMLLVPGRIGTSSPELGVPVTYTEISQFKAVCEVAYSRVGYDPELSYGSHMFQDLVEADIFYAAIHEKQTTRKFQPELLLCFPSLFRQLLPSMAALSDTVSVFDLSAKPATLYLDADHGRALCCF